MPGGNLRKENDVLAIIIVICISLLIPVILFMSISQFNLNTPHIRYSLTLGAAAVLGLMAFWAMKQDGISLSEVGLGRNRVLPALGLMAALWLLFALFMRVIPGTVNVSPYFTPAAFIQQWLFVGIAEELVFRGYILKRLVRLLGDSAKPLIIAGAVILTSLLFALWHIPVLLFNQAGPLQILITLGLLTAMGIYFSYLSLRTNNLLFTGLAHGSWNVPVLGVQGDFLQMIILLALVELYKLGLHLAAKVKHKALVS